MRRMIVDGKAIAEEVIRRLMQERSGLPPVIKLGVIIGEEDAASQSFVKIKERVAERLQVVVVRQAGDGGQLYGSVNARDIAQAVTDAGFTVTRQQVGLQNPIKEIGLHAVRVALHPEVAVKVTVNVARSPEEAKIQAKTGKALVVGEPEGAEETPAEEAARKARDEAAKFFEEGAAPVAEAAAENAAAEEGDAAAEATRPDKPKKKKKSK